VISSLPIVGMPASNPQRGDRQRLNHTEPLPLASLVAG
jgi:hypothetical protein